MRSYAATGPWEKVVQKIVLAHFCLTLCALTATVILVGCGGAKQNPKPAKAAASKASAAAASASGPGVAYKPTISSATLQGEINLLQGENNLLEQRVTALELSRQLADSPAYLSTVSPGYGYGHSPLGVYLVDAKKTAPYLDGYKLELTVENLSSAWFTGAKMKVSWGSTLQNTTSVALTNVFPPGRWTPVQVIVTPAKADDVKVLSVSLTFNNVSG